MSDDDKTINVGIAYIRLPPAFCPQCRAQVACVMSLKPDARKTMASLRCEACLARPSAVKEAPPTVDHEEPGECPRCRAPLHPGWKWCVMCGLAASPSSEN